MLRPPALLVSLLLVAGSLFVVCADEGPTLSADTAGWQRIDDKDDVVLYARSRLGSDIKEFKGTGIIDAPPGAVEKVLEDVASYTSFMPYVVEARVLSQAGEDAVTYQRLDIPFVAGRDYTLRVEHGTVRGPGGAMIYRDTWQTDNEAGPPEHRGTVRVKVVEGSWLLEPAEPAGDATQATYQIYTDSGGVLPTFIANRASQLTIPRLFGAIRKQVRDSKYLR